MPSIWLPDLPPASPGAEDDEFLDASGGVPGGWTEWDHGAVMTPSEDAAGLSLTGASQGGDVFAGVRKAIPAGDFTYWTKFSTSMISLTGNPIAGMALLEDGASSTGDLRSFGLRQDSANSAIGVHSWTAYNAFSATLAQLNIGVDVAPTHAYVRIRRTGTTYSFDWSTDGVSWQRVYTTAALGFVPQHIALVMMNNQSGGSMQARFPFFRYVASDVAAIGVVNGNRMLVGGAFNAVGEPSLEGLTASGYFAPPFAATGAPALGGLEAAGVGAMAYNLAPSSMWMPDVPALGGTASDDFNLNSGGVPAGWAEVDHGAVQTVTEDEAGLALTHPTHASDSIAGIYKTLPAGDFTIFMQCSRTGIGLTNYLSHGLALWEDATNAAGDVIFFGITSNGTQLELGVNWFSAYSTFFSALSGQYILSPDVLYTGFYLRVRRDGTTYHFEFSTDGIGWVRIVYLDVPANFTFTPAHFGPAMTNNNTGTTSVLRSKFCRYTASDIGLTGLSLGSRRPLAPAALGSGGLWRPEMAPPVPHALDDEFAVVGAGVPSGWAEADLSSRATVAVDDGGLVLTQIADTGGGASSGIYRTVPAGIDFTIVTKVSLAALWANPMTFSAGLAIWEDATSGPGNLVYTFGLELYWPNTTTKLELWEWTTYAARSFQIASLNQLNPGPGTTGVYLRMRRTGSTYDFDWSSDGVGWIHHSQQFPGAVPLHFGLFVMNADNNSGLDMSARFQFFRYRPENVGLNGLLEGNRARVTVA